jgi:hypothetical protein
MVFNPALGLLALFIALIPISIDGSVEYFLRLGMDFAGING